MVYVVITVRGISETIVRSNSGAIRKRIEIVGMRVERTGFIVPASPSRAAKTLIILVPRRRINPAWKRARTRSRSSDTSVGDNNGI